MPPFLLPIVITVLLLISARIYLLSPSSNLHRNMSISGITIGFLGFVEYHISFCQTVEQVVELSKYQTILSTIVSYSAVWGTHFFIQNISPKVEKLSFWFLIILGIPMVWTWYDLLFLGGAIDSDFELKDGVWHYKMKIGYLYYIHSVWFLLIVLYLSVTHLIVYLKEEQPTQRIWKLLLFLTFTIIPFSIIYGFIFNVNQIGGGTYTIAPYLAAIIIIISWIYTNFKLFEINPAVALDNILETIPSLVVVTDKNFSIEYTNREVEKMGINLKKYKKKSIVPLANRYLKIPTEKFETIIELKEKERFEQIFAFENEKNTIIHFLTIVSVVLNQKGKKIGYVFMLTDVTEKFEIRQALKQYAEKLENSNKELERFAYIASHDLKTPIRNIASFANLLERRLKNNPSQEIHDYLHFITSNARYMHRLVEDILEFSKIEKVEAFSAVNLNEVIRSTLVVLSDFMNEKRASVQSDELPTIRSSPILMGQLFQNLIENGVKYNESDQPTVEISAEEQPESIVLKIKDNGIGMDRQYQEQIFEMFKRLHTDTHYEGTGIGLAICRKIVGQHGGTIRVESEPQKGSTFIITFPKKEVEVGG